MTRIDFYLLQDVARDALHRFTCALAAKAASQGNAVFIHAADDSLVQTLDELLWAYPPNRFVPHETQISKASDCSVLIGTEAPRNTAGLMINTTDDVPPFFGRFDRVAEIVVQETRELGRSRYKHYRDRGCPLYHHELDDWEAA